MKYLVTLKDKTYEVEVEEGEAMILDEYEAKAPAAEAPAQAPVAPVVVTAAPSPIPAAAVMDGTPVVSPMPATVLSVLKNVGDAVAEGELVVKVEAMKMEVEVNAPSAGTVKQIVASVGQSVATGDTLMVI